MIDSLVKKSKLPTFVAPMGKGLVDETLPNFAGVYSGDGSFDSVREYIEASDCVLSIGGIQSDFNTTGFTYKIPPEALLDLHTNFSIINNTRYDLDMPSLVQAIEAHLDPSHMKTTSVNLPFSRIRANAPSSQDQYPPGTITQEYLWSKLSDWVQPHDILITETGTSYLGDWDTQFKSGMTAISQTLWSSIGYALPAAQGAALASRELGSKQRVILFEGDGSFQLTAQAISDMVRHKLDLIVFLLNNDGYTIERWVHGMEAGYNDISGWRYTDIPRAMGGDGSLVKTFKVATKEEMEALWMDPEFWNRKGLRVSLERE